ncbi:MAG: dephospho-CoA kinase [Aeromicrobium sp.]|nr:MAG: dephospho-CoA kinase [Aeromicrobium sp.]
MTLNVGLSGGIASGKSTVSGRFAQAGFLVIDYDVLAREVVEPGSTGLEQIEQKFGSAFIGSDGHLDRAKMGALVFTDKAALRQLEEITHPLIRDAAAALASTSTDVVVHDNPLLIEMGTYRDMDVVVIVDVPVDMQIDRMVQNRSMTKAEARNRLNNQVTRDERISVADIVIDNSGDFETLMFSVDRVIEQLKGMAANEPVRH